MSFTLPDNDEAFHNNQAIWMQTDINALIAAINGDGVVSGCVVSEDGGGVSMDLDITSGTIQINDTAYSITGSAAAVTIGVADGSNPRIDLVSAKSDDTLNVTAGTAAANPKAPDIPASSILLAMVYVPASDTTIADNQITDKRVIVRQVTATTQKTIQTHTILHSETLSVAGNFDKTSIDQTYTHLKIRLWAKSDKSVDTVDSIYLYFNNDTTAANYRFYNVTGGGGSPASGTNDDAFIGSVTAAGSLTDDFAYAEIEIPNYAGSLKKLAQNQYGFRRDATAYQVGLYNFAWENTAAINRITIQPDGYSTDKFIAGSYIEIIGIKEEDVLIVT